MNKNAWDNEMIVANLSQGGVVVMPTDTIYGIVGKALDNKVVERIYAIRKRDLHKPCIVLIGSVDELKKFNISLSEAQKNKLTEYWDIENSLKVDRVRPTSIIFDCLDESLLYLHRGTKTLAFRLPNIVELRELLLKTGPLIAPSANTEKFPVSENIEDAKKYFGDLIDLYVDGGTLISKASRVVRLDTNGGVTVFRE